METSSSSSLLLHKMSPPVTSSLIFSSINFSWKQKRTSIKVSAISYRKFIHFALDETKRNTHLVPSSLQERFNSMTSIDGKVELQMLSFEAPKIRLLRSLSIETETMQVFDFGVFPKPEYDVPIFCANFFTSGNTNIILLDLNPLHDVISQRKYKEKYYKGLMPLGVKYAELLPWGGKLTSESLKFFSPIVLWTKFTSSQCNHDVLFFAFMDYYKAWLQLMEEADPSGLKCNREAQHRYLTWRAEKDPGHRVLKKLIGEMQTKELLRNFLFNGIDELGSKSFLDYFPEYRCGDGTVNERRSMVGKSFESRPWDTNGEFIGTSF